MLRRRTLNTDPSSFGIVIFRAASEDEARATMLADPAVREGVMGYAPSPDVVAPESIHARLGLVPGPVAPDRRSAIRKNHKLDKSSPNWTQVANDRQPLCRDAGRSRAIVAGWLIAAAVAVLGLTGAWRSKRRGRETGVRARGRRHGLIGTNGSLPRVPVEFGIYVPQLGFDYAQIRERADACEALGFHSIWFFDHLYGPELPDLPSLEGWTLATAVLAQTTRLRVGHLVLSATFRHPALLAKMATTLDVISGGRLELGLGSGSYPPEHERAAFRGERSPSAPSCSRRRSRS